MHNMKLFPVQKNNKGFTLVETLVAIIILMSATAGIMVISGGTVGTTALAKNTIIANALSQEGIEMIRAIRDTSVLNETPGSGSGWQGFIDTMGGVGNGCFSNKGCIIQNIDEFYEDSGTPPSPSPDMAICADSTDPDLSSGCPFLTYDDGQGYGYGTGEETPFQRTLFVECIDDDATCQEIKVYSEIVWKQGSAVKNVTSVEHLFHWYTTEAPVVIVP